MAAEAGITRTISPHALRHACAFAVCRRTSDIALVQRLLGHRSIESTLVYARCSNERLREVVGA